MGGVGWGVDEGIRNDRNFFFYARLFVVEIWNVVEKLDSIFQFFI